MKDEDLARVNTLDRFEASVDELDEQLQQIRELIDYGESTGEPSYFIGARKKIAALLSLAEQDRHFIEVKRRYAEVDAVTAGVETLFHDGQLERRLDELQEDQHWQDEDIAE